ncbi:MAG: hypothetical protein FJ125_03135 [Deltaproteobacteria bacterium]|nr:hypothetical protein [Deltaproteobacteria bacterium]
MEPCEVLCKRFKNEAAAVYEILPLGADGQPRRTSPLSRYVISSNGTRNMLCFAEILNRNFTEEMVKGLTYAFIGIDRLEELSVISSKSVNVFHILRGGLNFRLVEVLRNAFGYKWHSSSFVSSQRVKSGSSFDVSDDAYRKFVIPENPTIYSGDIVATGVSLDNAMGYLARYLIDNRINLRNFVFVTIGCQEIEPILTSWHEQFKSLFPCYEKTILIYIEGRFVVAQEPAPLATKLPGTDLLRNYKLGSLHTPEFEYSQFEKLIIPLEACVIYDGGKKSFEPIHHMEEIRGFWRRQKSWAEQNHVTLWEEYNNRFPLDPYFADEEMTVPGSPDLLARQRSSMWWGLSQEEYRHLFQRFRWLWTDERLRWSRKPGSFLTVCDKKLLYLDSHIS